MPQAHHGGLVDDLGPRAAALQNRQRKKAMRGEAVSRAQHGCKRLLSAQGARPCPLQQGTSDERAAQAGQRAGAERRAQLYPQHSTENAQCEHPAISSLH